MKTAEIKALTLVELKEKLTTESKALEKLKFAHSVSPLENPMQIRVLRKTIARLNTELVDKTK
jgi:large subunit ribosomal protein L29